MIEVLTILQDSVVFTVEMKYFVPLTDKPLLVGSDTVLNAR